MSINNADLSVYFVKSELAPVIVQDEAPAKC
jgi:hypothetical protein